ncbi:MAG: glycosyltransferase [Dehalococcoidia bacterium]
MIYQLLVLAGLVIFFINLLLNLFTLKRPSKKAGLPTDLPLVSVLIPARNEENNIANCLASVMQQDYPNFEVLVVDDNSTDRTYEIVSQIAEADPRVRLYSGKPLPADWAGKPFAGYQLAQHARGDWFLFLDADTICESHMIRGTLEIAIKYQVALLSGFPRQKLAGLTQKIVLPVLFYFAQMAWFPLWLFHSSKKPMPTMIIGQFILFNRADYWRIGGHEAVKSRIMEDVWFGLEMSKAGGRTLAVDLSKTLTTEMYGNLAVMTEGCMKWFYSVAALSPLALVGFVCAAYIFFLAPFYWAYIDPVDSLMTSGQLTELSAVIAAQVLILLLMRVITDQYFRGSSISFIFHPLGVAFLILAVIIGASRRALGAGVAWKDRVYQGFTHIK